jgi:hypothetical protein
MQSPRKNRPLRIGLFVVGDEGFDLPLAGPELRSCKHSLQKKIPLQNATGISHPNPSAEGDGSSTTSTIE